MPPSATTNVVTFKHQMAKHVDESWSEICMSNHHLRDRLMCGDALTQSRHALRQSR